MKSDKEYNRETLGKIADVLEEQAEYLRNLPEDEVANVILLFTKLRWELENGRYDTNDKKWSELNWRA